MWHRLGGLDGMAVQQLGVWAGVVGQVLLFYNYAASDVKESLDNEFRAAAEKYSEYSFVFGDATENAHATEVSRAAQPRSVGMEGDMSRKCTQALDASVYEATVALLLGFGLGFGFISEWKEK